MESSAAISNLTVLFPQKTEDYLRRQYRRCDYDLAQTIQTINTSEQRNVSSNFFTGIFDIFAACCCCKTWEEIEEERGIGDVEFVEIDLGGEFAKRLTEKFSHASLDVPTGFKPVVEVPTAIGRQLYVAYVASAFRQQQAKIWSDLVREDEAFARLLEEHERNQKPTVSSQTEIPHVHAAKQLDVRHSGKHVVDTLDENDLTLKTFKQPATYYREEAQRHIRKRKQYYKQAQHCLKLNDRRRANQYFQLAKNETKYIEESNNCAAEAFLAENTGGKKDTIDLHHLYVKEAIQALDSFLDEEILNLEECNFGSKSLSVVTGRGKHSVNGIPKIKPAVMKRLEERSLRFVFTSGNPRFGYYIMGRAYYQTDKYFLRFRYSEINPGLLQVDISRQSYLSNEIA